jgi:hypothetical protein
VPRKGLVDQAGKRAQALVPIVPIECGGDEWWDDPRSEQSIWERSGKTCYTSQSAYASLGLTRTAHGQLTGCPLCALVAASASSVSLIFTHRYTIYICGFSCSLRPEGLARVMGVGNGLSKQGSAARGTATCSTRTRKSDDSTTTA